MLNFTFRNGFRALELRRKTQADDTLQKDISCNWVPSPRNWTTANSKQTLKNRNRWEWKLSLLMRKHMNSNLRGKYSLPSVSSEGRSSSSFLSSNWGSWEGMTESWQNQKSLGKNCCFMQSVRSQYVLPGNYNTRRTWHLYLPEWKLAWFWWKHFPILPFCNALCNQPTKSLKVNHLCNYNRPSTSSKINMTIFYCKVQTLILFETSEPVSHGTATE